MNKIFVLECTRDNFDLSIKVHQLVVVAACNIDVAREYVKEKIGIDVEPVWLMNATYPIIYVRDGSVPEKVQAKILYNGSSHSNLYKSNNQLAPKDRNKYREEQ